MKSVKSNIQLSLPHYDLFKVVDVLFTANTVGPDERAKAMYVHRMTSQKQERSALCRIDVLFCFCIQEWPVRTLTLNLLLRVYPVAV